MMIKACLAEGCRMASAMLRRNAYLNQGGRRDDHGDADG